jgi:periplasmic protein TonB
LPQELFSAIGSRTLGSGLPISRLPLPADVLPVTLAFSIVAHALLLLLTFSPPDWVQGKFTPQLDVVLVNARSSLKPAKADVLAQAHLDGGGNSEAERLARSNMPMVRQIEDSDAMQLASRRVEQLEQEAQRLLQLGGKRSVPDALHRPVQQGTADDRAEEPAAENRRLLVARLEAQIAKEWDAYQKMPRRKFIGARAEGVVYAEYVDRWRERIEKVGTAHFPDEAKRKRVYGSMLITVSIKADGSVEKVEIERSSGYRFLDTAALRIVHLAGPFPPFPTDIRSQYDVLSITRNWSFTRSDLEVTVAQ